MPASRAPLPQLGGEIFLTDGGLETWLIFHDHVELPCFAAFPLLETDAGRRQLDTYFCPFLQLARDRRMGFILDTVTWRANADWGAQLGYDPAALDHVNRQAVAYAAALARDFAGPANPVVVNGVLGPRGDGYRPDANLTADEAERYHRAQIAAFAAAGVSMVSALTLTSIEEAIGIARAAAAHDLPAVLSFTVETDGNLPSGATPRSAIEAVDRATNAAPAYYMLNCAHPSHFQGALADEGAWRERLRGLRANASAQSHAELDAATTLDAGDPLALAADYLALRAALPWLTVLGGCCGTDYRHVAAIAAATSGSDSG